MKKELQAQLDNFDQLMQNMYGKVGFESDYIQNKRNQLIAALEEADKVSKSKWNDQSLHDKMQEAAKQADPMSQNDNG